MRGFLYFGLFFVAISFGHAGFGASQAHWSSAAQIQVHFQTLKSASSVHFEILSSEGAKLADLPLQNRRGDSWTLSTERLSLPLVDAITQAAWIVARDSQETEILRTTIRMQGVLDEKFADTGTAWGLTWRNDKPTLRVWAPTARRLELVRFAGPIGEPLEILPMRAEPRGFWAIEGSSAWKGQYFLYRATLFSPFTERVETVEATDPLSVSLSMDGRRSQIVDLEDPKWQPRGWSRLAKPKLEKVTDAVIYEIHLRDFTAGDSGLATDEQGRYEGLVHPRSKALAHLKELARAGLTHVHFLPLLDFGAISENPEQQSTAEVPAALAPDSAIPQERVGAVRDTDNYNWGYNPLHWMTPEGSYAREPDGASRVRELRAMVGELNKAGLRVVFDVVFNHTYASGLEDGSNFDRLVPGYYHRYDARGELMKSSCCADIATENVMVEKLILDSLVFLAKTYKVDGFRFDLMNLHPKNQVARIQQALSGMNARTTGVDGANLLLYAEAWPFGSLEDLKPGSAFTQLRSYGLGMGVFNDRLRDALRGGSTDSHRKSDQGFATGLYWDFNREPANTDTPPDAEAQRNNLLVLNDVVKIGMAGNLRDLEIRDHLNHAVRGGDFIFRGSPVAYAAEPSETITYVSAHDGTSLWDAVQAKLPFHTSGRNPRTASIEDRVRAQKLMLATVLVSQGIPFLEGGSELLRSKSGDVDSYDSGDWFNKIDWSLNGNNWGAGLPPAWRNQSDWAFWRPRLADPDLTAGAADIASTFESVKSLLRLRKAQPLLRLPSSADILRSVSFPRDEKSGGDLPGLVALLIEDETGEIDPRRRALAIFVNAASEPQDLRSSKLAGRAWRFPDEYGPAEDARLAQAAWSKEAGTVHVPARTVLVIEEAR